MAAERTQALMHILDQRLNNVFRTYPLLAAPVTVTGGVGGWALGAKAEIVPVDTITKPFTIVDIVICNVSADDCYAGQIYTGLAGAEVVVAEFAFSRENVFTASLQETVFSPIIAANERISIDLASSSGGGDTADFKVQYVEYD